LVRADINVKRRPDLFIIGAAKCGTTTLYEWLKGHPQVFMSPAKEPRYFAPDLDSGSGNDLVHGRDRDRYLALFAGATTEKRLGEASVRYIYSKAAPRLIHEFQPRPYIVAMLRNPIDMMHSMHAQRLYEGVERQTDFEQALAADGTYTERARFAAQLRPWFETFGRERVHVIIFEDMVRDPAAVFRQLLDFLEVDPEWQPKAFAAYNTSHAPRSQLLRRLTKSRLPQWLVWQVLPRIIGDRGTRRLVRAFRHSPIDRRPAPRAPLSPALRQRLEVEFADDVAAVSELLDRDLAALWWKGD
jgi:hypothetical protein